MAQIMHIYQSVACVFYGFIYIGLMQRCQNAEALQCYVCENCVEGTELQVMQICGELPIESTLQPPTQSAATTLAVVGSTSAQNGSTNAPTTTTKGGKDEENDSDDDSDDSDDSDDDDDEDRRRHRDDIRTVTFAETTIAAIFTASESSSALINEDSYEDESERSFSSIKANAKMSAKQKSPVCFMVKFQMNGENFTNLGCTSMVDENEYLTCVSLFPNTSAINDCRLCSINGCNKFYFNLTNDGVDWDYDYQSSSCNLSFDVLEIFLALYILKLFL